MFWCLEDIYSQKEWAESGDGKSTTISSKLLI